MFYNSTKSLNIHIQLEREIRMRMNESLREMRDILSEMIEERYERSQVR